MTVAACASSDSASRSVWRVTYVVVAHSIESPGSNTIAGHETLGADPVPVKLCVTTESEESVSSPVFVTRMLYRSCCPAAVISLRLGVCERLTEVAPSVFMRSGKAARSGVAVKSETP